MTAHQPADFNRNAFHTTLLGLEYTESGQQPADIFSRACVESFQSSDWTRFGYRFTQVFEDAVLQETAILEGVPYDDLAGLRHRPTQAMRRLGDALDNRMDLSFVERLNLASALTSVTRLDLADTVLTEAMPLARSNRERFEAAWLAFILANRRDDGARSAAAFAAMREAIGSGDVPTGRALDACTQAVVWYLKRKDVTEDDFAWSVKVGNALAGRAGIRDASTVSAWYRGLAMLPAARGMSGKTRSYMESARVAAEESVKRSSQAYELNLIKTYHESSLKEHMYVTKDVDAAIAAGQALIELDPAWSISYGELAEAHLRFGHPRQAAELYDKAVASGPPYVGHHLLQAATCWEKADTPQAALTRYEYLAALTPKNAEVLTRGLDCARRLSHSSLDTFTQALERLDGIRTTP
ncbi:hypothetical protein OG481_31510 [Streptomyces longwoodensis]|uniref:tetratricopeptide repeat protein n=1 Tax=Streptomyces longwoodensis TaxID=68231 RepID=UPI002DDB21ED|nr:hypothetical protein [Streptomyces longwoodensis]WRY92745.1 hypothetical protein OG481_31510 [Streptomyces longwoodensis]